MKTTNFQRITLAVSILFLVTACSKSDESMDSPKENFTTTASDYVVPPHDWGFGLYSSNGKMVAQSSGIIQQATFVTAGATVVTDADGTCYKSSTVNANPMEILIRPDYTEVETDVAQYQWELSTEIKFTSFNIFCSLFTFWDYFGEMWNFYMTYNPDTRDFCLGLQGHNVYNHDTGEWGSVDMHQVYPGRDNPVNKKLFITLTYTGPFHGRSYILTVQDYGRFSTADHSLPSGYAQEAVIPFTVLIGEDTYYNLYSASYNCVDSPWK